MDTNKAILTATDIARQREAAQRAKQRAAAEPPPISKAQAKKLAQIQARKEKAALRESLVATLSAHQLSDAQLRLMSNSGKLGQTQSKRQALQRALHAKKEGVELEDLVPLEVDRTSLDDEELALEAEGTGESPVPVPRRESATRRSRPVRP